jgi:filamentous hemagglutinin
MDAIKNPKSGTESNFEIIADFHCGAARSESNFSSRYCSLSLILKGGAAEQLARKGITIRAIPGLQDLSRADARAVEQVLIETYGLGKNGGSLVNKINSISQNNPIYADALRRGVELLKQAFYPGF